MLYYKSSSKEYMQLQPFAVTSGMGMLAEVRGMGRANILNLALFMVFLLLNPKTECAPTFPPIAVRPLCASQFALVNHACSLLPFNPGPPPSPSPPDDDGNEHEHGHGHRHGHRHRHHRHQETPVEQDCCRWVKEVDAECVCELLVYLPPFLSRPVHQYSIIVDDSCNITYPCGGRVRI